MKNDILHKVIFGVVAFNIFATAQIITPYKAYNIAIENSNAIKSSRYEYQAHKEELYQYYAKLLPNIEGSISYNDTRYERNELINLEQYKVKEVSNNYMIGVSQPIFDYELFTRISTESKRVDLYKLSYEIDVQDLASDVIKTYIDIFKSKNRIELLDSYIKYNEKNFQLLDKKYQMSLASKMDYLEAKVEYEKLKLEYISEKNNYDTKILKLKQLLDLNEIEIPTIQLESFFNNIIGYIDELKNLGDDYNNNIALNQAKLAIDLGVHEEENAFSAHYPKLSFDARYTEYDSESENIDYENYSTMSLTLKIPIFSGGAISSRVDEMRLKTNSAKEDYLALEKDTKIKFNESKIRLENTLENMKVYDEALQSANAYLESVQLGYDKGLKSILDFYDAKNKLYDIKSDYLDNISNFLESYVTYSIVTNHMERLSIIDTLLQK